MNLEYIFAVIVSFFMTYKIAAVILAVAVLLMLWKKPAELFRIGIFLLIMVVLFYLIQLLGNSMFQGVGNKNEAATKTERSL